MSTPRSTPALKVDDKAHGLYRKYSVKRLRDREKKHARCEYFVLDLIHDPYAGAALAAYADACEAEYPELAADLSVKAMVIAGRNMTRKVSDG